MTKNLQDIHRNADKPLPKGVMIVLRLACGAVGSICIVFGLAMCMTIVLIPFGVLVFFGGALLLGWAIRGPELEAKGKELRNRLMR